MNQSNPRGPKLVLVPTNIGDANELVKRWHRHHKPVLSALFAVACAFEGASEPCGAAIIGRPVARRLQDGWTAEVVRCVTDGTKNAPSMLYGAAWRAARALGYRRLVTYTLKSESGTTMRAAGWTLVGETPGKSWSVPSRPRVDKHPLEPRFRWEAQSPSPASGGRSR